MRKPIEISKILDGVYTEAQELQFNDGMTLATALDSAFKNILVRNGVNEREYASYTMWCWDNYYLHSFYELFTIVKMYFPSFTEKKARRMFNKALSEWKAINNL